MTTAPRTLVVGCLFLVAPYCAQAAWPPSNCTHVKVLESHDTDEIQSYEDARLEDAGADQLDVLGEALDMMPEVL